MKHILCEIISVGDEILYGQILNTNAQYLSQVMNDLGVRVTRHTTVQDEAQAMLNAFEEAESKNHIVLITGGLGPTPDDLTKPLLAKMYNSPISLHQQALDEVTNLFLSRGRELSELNRQQAFLPEKCTFLSNRVGTAPGMWFERNTKVLVSMPGVPHEVKVLMEEQVIPKIRLRFTMPVIYHKMIRTAGIPESKLAEVIREWESELPMHIRLAYLPKLAQVRLRLTAFGDDLDSLKREVEEQIDKVMPTITKYAYGFDDDELELVIGKLLLEKGYTIATAESCTGGYIAHQITSVPGSSAYYLGSIIPYHNQFKQNLLGVNEETLIKFGAVSEECVKEMAENVRKKFGSDVGLATSGIAGPTGGSVDKPIGTVWVAVSTPSGTTSRLLRLTKERGLNIQLTGTASLYMIWRTLVEMS